MQTDILMFINLGLVLSATFALIGVGILCFTLHRKFTVETNYREWQINREIDKRVDQLAHEQDDVQM